MLPDFTCDYPGNAPSFFFIGREIFTGFGLHFPE